MAIRTLSDTASGCHTLLCKLFTFLNACISVKTNPINTKLGDFVNLCVLSDYVNQDSYLDLHGLKSGNWSVTIHPGILSEKSPIAKEC